MIDKLYLYLYISISIFLYLSLYLCLCIHSHILLILFLWKILTNTSPLQNHQIGQWGLFLKFTQCRLDVDRGCSLRLLLGVEMLQSLWGAICQYPGHSSCDLASEEQPGRTAEPNPLGICWVDQNDCQVHLQKDATQWDNFKSISNHSRMRETPKSYSFMTCLKKKKKKKKLVGAMPSTLGPHCLGRSSHCSCLPATQKWPVVLTARAKSLHSWHKEKKATRTVSSYNCLTNTNISYD